MKYLSISSGHGVVSRGLLFFALAFASTAGCAWGQFVGTPVITDFTNGSPRNNFTGSFGMKFTVGAAPLNVTALGRLYLAGNNAAHVLKLVNADTGTDIAGGAATVFLTSGTPGTFVYAALASPVTLAAGAAYYLVSSETLNGDQFFDLAGVTPASVVTVNAGEVYWPGNGYYSIGGANGSFGPVNFLYTLAGPPPTVSITAPSAAATVFGNVTLTATAAAATGLSISTVQFQVDGANYGAPATTSPYSVVLDTTKLTNGTHTLDAVATDSGLDSATSDTVSITVNNQATTISISSPASGATVSGSQVTVSAAAIPASGKTISAVQFQVDQTNYGAPVTVSPYAILLDSTKLTDGQHSLIAVATDSGGNSVSSAPVNVVVNNSVTTVAITTPPAGATVSGTNVTVTAAATARIGFTITQVQFQVDNATQGAPVTATPYTIALDSTQLSNGTHSLVAIATDSSGATINSAPVSITVSNGSGGGPLGTPLITGFAAKLVRSNFTGSFGMKITVGAQPINVTSLGRIYIAGNTNSHNVRLVTAATGVDLPGGSVTVSPATGTPGQFVYAPLASPVTLAANGVYYLLSDEVSGGDQFYDLAPVNATNVVSVNSGEVYWPGIGFYSIGGTNSSYGPVNLLYVAAVAPPTVSITAPAAGVTVSGSAVNVTASASAATGLFIAKVQFQVDNVDYGAAATVSPYSIVLDSTKLANGTHILTAVATDTASDTNTSAPISITVSNTPTTVSITAPSSGATVSGNKVAVTATATPAAGLTITSVQFQLDRLNYGAAVTTSPYGILLDSTLLSDGPHTLSAVATDSAGTAVTSTTVNIVVNNSSTSVSITAPVAGATVSGTSVVLAATATPRSGLTITNVQFQVDNLNQGAPVTVGPYSIILDSTKLSNGTHTVAALATDSSGNAVAAAAITITVTNGPTPPTVGTPLISGFTAGPARNNFTGAFGMKFTTGAVPITVTALGRIYIDGNNQDHLLKLVDAATGADVPGGATVVSLPSGTPGQFAYSLLAAPLALAPNTTYYLMSSETNGGDQFYNFGPVVAAPVVNVNSATVFWPGVGFYSIGPANSSFGPVNLLYAQ